MLAPQGHIIVKVDHNQKDVAKICGNVLKTGKDYNENFRERNPVIAEVVDGFGEITKGSFIVCNYNYFDLDSPLQLTDDLYAIPVNEEIFAIVKENGTLKPIQGNVLVERVTKDTPLLIPEELKQPHNSRGIILTNTKGYTKGQFIFWLPMADYEICYYWNGEEKTAIKIHESEIVGYIKN